MMEKIRLAVCDDFKDFREYFEFFCRREDDIECVATAGGSEDCLNMVKAHMPDILLLDIQMETDDSGVKLIPELLKINPNMKIIMLTAHIEDDYVYTAFSYGAIDYLNKSMSFEEMMNTIRNISHDNVSIRPEIAKILATGNKRMKSSIIYLINILVKLSPTEYEILKAVYDGKSYQDIADERCVSLSTIKNQVSRIIKKFDAHFMQDIVSELRELKIFEYLLNNNM